MFSIDFYRSIHSNLFKKAWPKWVGGIVLALFNILLFLYLMPFGGIYPAMAEWGVWSYRIAGINAEHPWGIAGPLHLSIISVLTFGFLLGALISKKFKIRKAGVDVYVIHPDCFLCLCCMDRKKSKRKVIPGLDVLSMHNQSTSVCKYCDLH